jgi:hypothetical protein
VIGMVNDSRRMTLGMGHRERIEEEPSREVRCYRPAHNATTERVQDDGQLEKAGPGRHVRNVRAPELIRCARRTGALLAAAGTTPCYSVMAAERSSMSLATSDSRPVRTS